MLPKPAESEPENAVKGVPLLAGVTEKDLRVGDWHMISRYLHSLTNPRVACPPPSQHAREVSTPIDPVPPVAPLARNKKGMRPFERTQPSKIVGDVLRRVAYLRRSSHPLGDGLPTRRDRKSTQRQP